MEKLRFFFAMLMGKCSYIALKVLRRNATFLPGKIAVTICPNFLGHLTKPKTIVAITGTNGKTTTSNLIASILKTNGYDIINNSLGSNVQAGIATTLMIESSFIGKPKKDLAILEVDERSSLKIYPYIKPNYIICNNIMRDSLKRNANTEFISYIINNGLQENAKLIVNGDDMIASQLGDKGQEHIYFGIEAEKPEVNGTTFIQDIVYCPKCGEILENEYIRYNHIGHLYCPKCGYKNHELDYAVTNIDRENNRFDIKFGKETLNLKLINDNIVNIYNFCGVVAVLKELGLSNDEIIKGFEVSEIVKTRLDEITVGKNNIMMLLAKGQNPIACSRCYDYVSKINKKDKTVIIMVDDYHDNMNDSENTSWLYDSDYSALKDDSITQLLFAGPRAKDHLLRALIAGIDKNKISIYDNGLLAAEAVDLNKSHNIYVLYDMYIRTEANNVKAKLMERSKA